MNLILQRKEKNKKLDLFELFPLHPDHYIHLEQFTCICMGNKDLNNNCKTIDYFQFISCEKLPLKGKHMIEYNNQKICISSPCDFQRNILQFKNNINFDKCTYLYHEKGDCLIKLRLIRNRIILPLFNGNVSSNTCNYVFTNNLNIKMDEMNPSTVTTFTHHMIETLFYTYKSKTPNKGQFNMIINAFKKNMLDKIASLQKQETQEEFIYSILNDDFQEVLRELTPDPTLEWKESFEISEEEINNMF